MPDDATDLVPSLCELRGGCQNIAAFHPQIGMWYRVEDVGRPRAPVETWTIEEGRNVCRVHAGTLRLHDVAGPSQLRQMASTSKAVANAYPIMDTARIRFLPKTGPAQDRAVRAAQRRTRERVIKTDRLTRIGRDGRPEPDITRIYYNTGRIDVIVHSPAVVLEFGRYTPEEATEILYEGNAFGARQWASRKYAGASVEGT